MENKYHPSSDPGRANEITQLLKCLNEYTSLRKDSIADLTAYFFKPYHLEGPQAFTIAAARTLKIFATEKKIRNLFRYKSDNDYYIVCRLLENVIIFCNELIRNEANVIRLEKSKWEIFDTSHISLDTIINEKKKYQRKIFEVKEIMLNRERLVRTD